MTGLKIKKLPKIKYINSYLDNRGTVRFYVRYKGKKHPDCMKTDPFKDRVGFELEKADKLAELRHEINKKGGEIPAGTLDWLAYKYFASPKFKKFKAGTRSQKRGVLEGILKTHGHHPYIKMNITWGIKIRDEKAQLPAAANNRLKALQALYTWAIKQQLLPDGYANPIEKVERLDETSNEDRINVSKCDCCDGHHVWNINEIEQYRKYWKVGTMQRLAFEVIYWTGTRVSDAYRLGKHMEQNGMIQFTAKKNDKPMEIPLAPELKKIIEKTPSGQMTYLVHTHGMPHKSEKTFSKWLVKARKKAGLPDRCVPHGIRKGTATIARKAGASTAQLRALFGWQSDKMADHYTKKAYDGEMAKPVVEFMDYKKTAKK